MMFTGIALMSIRRDTLGASESLPWLSMAALHLYRVYGTYIYSGISQSC